MTAGGSWPRGALVAGHWPRGNDQFADVADGDHRVAGVLAVIRREVGLLGLGMAGDASAMADVVVRGARGRSRSDVRRNGDDMDSGAEVSGYDRLVWTFGGFHGHGRFARAGTPDLVAPPGCVMARELRAISRSLTESDVACRVATCDKVPGFLWLIVLSHTSPVGTQQASCTMRHATCDIRW